ncbi:hypothetical protein [Streptomyces buecherae]|uniref:hypothetical protein n=1 Tax=Streptomyces buecherae TaxID=2763006 RepID=UPI0037892B7D
MGRTRWLVQQPRRPLIRTPRPAIWEAYAVVWQRARPLLWRGTERVGTATVTGTLDVVLAGLANPCWR